VLAADNVFVQVSQALYHSLLTNADDHNCSNFIDIKVPYIGVVALQDGPGVRHMQVVVSVQYQVTAIYDAFYKLTDSRSQITSYVFDVVRATVPKIYLDDVFTTKDEIALGSYLPIMRATTRLIVTRANACWFEPMQGPSNFKDAHELHSAGLHVSSQVKPVGCLYRSC
jgi:hypothetical protein